MVMAESDEQILKRRATMWLVCGDWSETESTIDHHVVRACVRRYPGGVRLPGLGPSKGDEHGGMGTSIPQKPGRTNSVGIAQRPKMSTRNAAFLAVPFLLD